MVSVFLSVSAFSQELPQRLIVAVELGENREKPETGLAPPLVKLIEELNVQTEYYYCPWARCLLAMQNGDVDLLDKLYLTQERQTFIEYLSPAYITQSSTFRFYSHKNSDYRIRTLDDLKQKSIGVVRSAVYFPDFDYNQQITKVSQIHLSNVIMMAAAKRVDALIAAPEFTIDVIRSYPQGDQLVALTLSNMNTPGACILACQNALSGLHTRRHCPKSLKNTFQETNQRI